MQVKSKHCKSWEDVADIVSYNAESVAHSIRKLNRKYNRLAFNGIIFGIAGIFIGLKIREMEDQISELHKQIGELKDKEG